MNKRGNTNTILIILIVILLFVGLGVFGYYYYENNYKKNDKASDIDAIKSRKFHDIMNDGSYGFIVNYDDEDIYVYSTFNGTSIISYKDELYSIEDGFLVFESIEMFHKNFSILKWKEDSKGALISKIKYDDEYDSTRFLNLKKLGSSRDVSFVKTVKVPGATGGSACYLIVYNNGVFTFGYAGVDGIPKEVDDLKGHEVSGIDFICLEKGDSWCNQTAYVVYVVKDGKTDVRIIKNERFKIN